MRTVTNTYTANYFTQVDAATFAGGAIGPDQSIQITVSSGSAIIYGTVALNQGPAAEVIQAPGTVTRLWLGVLPGGDPAQRNLSGTMHQETHLRFYVPVKKADNQRAP